MAGSLGARVDCWRAHVFTFFKRNRRAIGAFEHALVRDIGMR